MLTLNPAQTPQEILLQANYNHPLFDRLAIDSQQKIPQIQGEDSIYHCGAWTRYGFHEDGLLSAVKVAELFDIATPWKITA